MFTILFEVLLIEFQEEIHHFAGWEGGLRGTKIVNKSFVNKLPGSPFLCFFRFLCFFGVVSTLAFFVVHRAFGGSKKRSFDEKKRG